MYLHFVGKYSLLLQGVRLYSTLNMELIGPRLYDVTFQKAIVLREMFDSGDSSK
jgi:hypothetical protein